MAMIGSVIGAVSTLAAIYDRLGEGREDGQTVKEALERMNIDSATVKLTSAEGNMVNFLRPFIVEPTIFITKNANSRSDANTILEHTVDVYASFYLQAFKALNNIYNVTHEEALTVLANKGFDYESMSDTYEFGVSDVENISYLPNLVCSNMDQEDLKISRDKSIGLLKEDGVLATKTIIRQLDIVVKSNVISIRDSKLPKLDSNGNAVDNKIKTDDTLIANVPIIIKANVIVMDLDTISNSVEHRASNAGFFKRVLQWKVGIISTADFLLAGDLVDSYKKGALTKENFGKVLDGASTNHINIQAILDKKPGLNKIVFSYIMTDSELELLGKRMGYNINKGSDKTDMMNALLALNITSINEDRDMVSVYINGISGMTPSPIKKLSKSGGKDGGDAIELLASALMSNKSVF
jgi:hypothetical protein